MNSEQKAASIYAMFGISEIASSHSLSLDEDFLIMPELSGLQIEETQTGFFTTPTPGDLNGLGFLGFVDEAGKSCVAAETNV